MKRRSCSYDIAAVPKTATIVTDEGGETYLGCGNDSGENGPFGD
jgi:hypothetical protein